MFGGLLQRLPQLWPADEGNVEPAQVVLLQLPGQRACPNTKARDLLCPGKKEKVVELLSELRKEAYLVAYMPESPDTTPEEASRLVQYAGTLYSCRQTHTEKLATLKIWWTSSVDPHTYELAGSAAELTMAIVALAAAWRRLGRQYSHDLMDLADRPAEHVENAKKAVDYLKRAAAAFEYVAGHLDCFELVAKDRRPPEVCPGVAKGLAQLALAEAQAVFAHRADVSGKSQHLLAGLYVAAQEQFQEAGELFKRSEVGAVQLLIAYTVLSATLQESRARIALAAESEEASEAHVAWGHATAAENLLAAATSEVKQPRWRSALAAEAAAVQGIRAQYQETCEKVTLKPRPKDLPPLPPAKASTAARVPFDPSQLPSLQPPPEVASGSSPGAMLGNALEGARALWQKRS